MHNNLTKWIEDNGGYIHPQLYIKSTQVNGVRYNSVFYKNSKPIKEDSILTKIPDKLCITEDSYNSIPNIKEHSKLLKDDDLQIKLAISLLYETLQKEKSFFYPFIQTLPSYDSFNNYPVYIAYKDNKAFKILDSLKVNFTQQVLHVAQTLNSFVENMKAIQKEVNPFATKLSSHEFEKTIIWAFFISNIKSWGEMIIPFNDNFNHDQVSDMFVYTPDTKEIFHQINADKQFSKKGAKDFEVFYHYSSYDLMSFKTHNNFVPRSKVDFLTLPLQIGFEDDLTNLRFEEYDKCNFNSDKFYISNDGVSLNVLAALRIFSLNRDEYNIYSKKDDRYTYYRKLNNENEFRTIRYLIATINSLKKINYTVEIMSKTDELLNFLKAKNSLSTPEKTIQDICFIKLREKKVIEDSLEIMNKKLKVLRQLI